MLGEKVPRMQQKTIAKVIVAAGVLILLTLAWNFTPLSSFADAETIKATMLGFAESRWAPMLVLAAFLAGGLVAFPATLLIIGTAAAFGPVFGFVYATVGALASALLMYAIGAWIGREALQNVMGPRLTRVQQGVARRGVLAVAAIRLVPIAPYTLVNMVAGASGIRLFDYTLGTALGLLPGLLVLSALGHQLFQILVAPSAGAYALLAGAIVLWITIVFGAQVVIMRLRSDAT
jgi:uncharacterized membrane protein YdjX (TVP38/TMEM64 family)